MKKTSTIILLLLLPCLVLPGQDRRESDSYKKWSDGPLVISDFSQRRAPDNFGRDVNLEWRISFDEELKKVGNLKYQYTKSILKMDKLSSWHNVNSSRNTEDCMKYVQTKFDLLEINRRKMQDEINRNPNDNSIMKYYSRLINGVADTFDQETALGTDTQMVEEYALKCRADLENYQEATAVAPEAGPRGIMTCCYFGYAGTVFGKGMNSVFKMMNGVEFGLRYGSGRFGLDFFWVGGSLGKPAVDGALYDEENDYYWTSSKKATCFDFGVSASYIALSEPYWSVVPFIGFNVSDFSQKTDLKKSDNSLITSSLFCPQASVGMDLNYKINRTLLSDMAGKNYSESSVVLRVYGSKMFLSGGGSYALNFGILYNWSGWTILSKS